MAKIALEPWSEAGYELLVRLNAPRLTEHLGGPETAEQVRRRHERYLENAADGEMLLVVFEHEAVGSVGYWPRHWGGLDVYETGYGIVPEYQGRGFASAALGLCAEYAARAAQEGSGRRWLHAFPSIHNAASNAVCRKAGFEPAGECDLEYPPGRLIRVNDWRLALTASPAG
ncbi:GNAT family N-acetyltransferase [Actinospica sp. MGRD01-02]|uniref:GNAT family N-acetyltransferase n=1 Tax=Actinospica acidithermotolerans TaxID=2828514 RepID=A0A941EIJ1_9ACTN|nr:GNAT family N-acetyltransferase [Actinospica acidithermotolerans]MBR7831172.1 GNAT family N-acetyltransferase [Actinospica acidithermotolerans]